MNEQLTVENVHEVCERFISRLGSMNSNEREWEAKTAVSECLNFLLSQLATIERETAEKCAEIANETFEGFDVDGSDIEGNNSARIIRNHFKLIQEVEK